MTLYEDRKRDTDVKNRLLVYVGEGEGGVIWENSIETCIVPYVKQMTSASSIHEARHSKLVLWDNAVRWDAGGGFRIGVLTYTRGWVNIWLNHQNTVK